MTPTQNIPASVWQRAGNLITASPHDSWLGRSFGSLEHAVAASLDEALASAGRPSVDHSLLDTLEEQVSRGRSLRTVGLDLLRAPWRLRGRLPQVAPTFVRANRELLRIAAGRSELGPPPGDRRFASEAWSENPLLRRLLQLYLTLDLAADQAIAAAELDWRSEQRLRLAVTNVVDALAPTNFLLTNPDALKRVIDTGGKSLVRGLRQLARDMASEPRIPASVDQSKFRVAGNLARSPGAVVLRTPMLELIQYAPVTETVRAVPLLLVSSMVNKYYILDLAPKRSLVEYLVAHGHTVFAVSWRNPAREQSAWDFERYAGAILDALDAIGSITGSREVNVTGLCAGGMVTAAVASVLAHRGEGDRIRSLTLSVCAVDPGFASAAGAMITRETAPWLKIEAARRGYVEGNKIAGTFAWLRPNEGVWSYWVNNYLLGKPPPAVDILYWAADMTNVPGALNRDMIRISLENAFLGSSDFTCLGSPVDLRPVRADNYVIAAASDHLTPWPSCYAATGLLGGRSRFVLSSGGHISATVNPPRRSRGGYWAGHARGGDHEQWLAATTLREGSWWPDWVRWLTRRAGPLVPAPASLGSETHRPLEPAPGSYVMVRSE